MFSDLTDIPIHHVNAEGKIIQETVDTQKERQSSVLCRIKNSLGLGGGMPKAYKTHHIEYRENELKYLKNQKIVDFLMFEDSDSVGFLELENGYIITETTFSPHGTGMAGLTYFQDIIQFEERCGKDYQRFKEQLD